MSLLVTGTIGIDTIDTPSGRADSVLGGSATYFAFAARLLAPVRLVGVVGDDLPAPFRQALNTLGIDTAGLETRTGSKTFRWHGKYHDDMNVRDTLRTDLNVIAEEPPAIPDAFRDSKFVFLANTAPAIQSGFVEQLAGPGLVICDTMDLWINEAREALVAMLSKVHGIVINDGEARLLTGKAELICAGRTVLDWGPDLVVIKKGKHGSMLVTRDAVFVLPAYPTADVRDPTGAGDSFAGGMMGYLASVDRTDEAAVRTAMAWGTCVASIAIEAFSTDALKAADRTTLDKRMASFRSMLSFES